jgi:hypothetical protein
LINILDQTQQQAARAEQIKLVRRRVSQVNQLLVFERLSRAYQKSLSWQTISRLAFAPAGNETALIAAKSRSLRMLLFPLPLPLLLSRRNNQ